MTSIVVYDGGAEEKHGERFAVHFERFKTQRAAQREANEAETGKVVGFIPLDLSDPAIQALASVVKLQELRLDELQLQDLTGQEQSMSLLNLLRDIFLAGRESVKESR